MIDLLYVSFNRREMTEVSFKALISNTNWGVIPLHGEHSEQITRVFIADDGSTDGTREYLDEAAKRLPVEVIFNEEPFRGPVRAMNWYLDSCGSEVEKFIKIDNDFVLCPGWLEDVAIVDYLNPGTDIIGMEPMHGPPSAPPNRKRSLREAPWIGGKGLIRHRAFTYCRPNASGPQGRRGFTEYQARHPEISKAWIVPDFPCFGLDQLPFEPWITLADEYEVKKWARRWNAYEDSMWEYWQWMFPDWESQRRAA